MKVAGSIAGIVIFAIIALIVVAGVVMKDDMGLMIKEVTGGGKNAFESHYVEREKIGGKHMVSFKDVITSSADMLEGRYYRADITVSSSSRSLAAQLEDNEQEVVAIMGRVLARYKPKDVQSGEGKERLKQEIKEEMNKYYKSGQIEDIYFENFVYN